MIDRRRFLTQGAAALTVPVFVDHATAAARQIQLPFDTVVVDGRIASSEALARFESASQVPHLSIRGNLPKLWFDSLRNQLLERDKTIAGITSDLDSEIMRAFARDVGYGQAQRIDVTVDHDAKRRTIHRPIRAEAWQTACTSGLEEMLDHYMSVPLAATAGHAAYRLTAWVVAPMPG